MGRKKIHDKVPTHDKMMIPTLEALKLLGGSGSIDEINEKVYEVAGYDEEVLEIPHDENGVQTKVEYRLAWARTYLKKYGLIDNSSRGVWALIDNEIDTSKLDADQILKTVRELTRKPKTDKKQTQKELDSEIEEEIEDQIDWKENLISVILKIEPSAFERLCQRILRESGFVQVEVTGKSGDGGIDGKGIVRLNGFLSFHVFFQSKRYKGSVGSGDIRDFRGAMQGRADKGLFITTGNFTREAIKEATRDGAPPIDLIDGELLCDKLKEFNLGVKTELIEEVSVNAEWFSKI
ncbi:restriction endonuclease [Polaribacter reichenbachii]|uniref:Restriction endonuclease n=2 Tax=Polaribacter reichenbachii TaxID=996801 RepID=A0A1B8U309_9FLAO|nr:restriction endonuclease [Polaribacter reichenbachii]AUC18339.1 restriction endonuclease [Polaribacter reichenbachii]OBY66231.1 restriction endonuclease [Polaribacter reichenbachii]